MTRPAGALAGCTLALGVIATAALPAGIGGAATGKAVDALMTGSQQIIDNSIRSRDVKNGTLQAKDIAPATLASLRGEAGPPGLPGAPGPQGPEGQKGEPAPPAVVQTVQFSGSVAPIAPNSGTYVFAGQPGIVTTTLGHTRVVGTATAALGLAAGSPAAVADLGMCSQPAAGGALSNFVGPHFIQHGFSASRQSYGAAATVELPPGTYRVGLCVRNSSSQTISNNNYANGYAQVTQ